MNNTPNTQVWVFGSGDCGQLAIDEDTWSVERPLQHPFFPSQHIIQVSAGGLHTLALSAHGHVYSWGCNDEKALGHEAPEFTVSMVQGLEGVQVVQVVAGDSISAALSAQGQVYTWGTFRDSKGLLGHSSSTSLNVDVLAKRKPTPINEDDLMQSRPVMIPGLSGIRSIAAGSNQLFAINTHGELFSWGCGEQGQLGRRVLERHKHLGLRPTNVTPRMGRQHIPIAKVAPGAYHTLLLTTQGQVYAMGHNNYGQLGTGDMEACMTPMPLSFNEPIIDAACGEHHSLVLTQSGRLYAAGRNDAGELGCSQDSTSHSANFVPVQIPVRVRSMAAGGHHSLAVSEDERVYAWGYGEMHQLGLGHDQVVHTPTPLSFTSAVLQASCGAQHSVMLTK